MKKLFNIYNLMKVVGFALLGLAIYGLVLTFNGFGDFESNDFMIGGFLTVAGVMMCGVGLMIGFTPEITKARAKAVRYLQEENKEDLSSIASTGAEIMSDAITKTASALSEGLNQTKFCKHCGARIDADSRFCSACGKEL